MASVTHSCPRLLSLSVALMSQIVCCCDAVMHQCENLSDAQCVASSSVGIINMDRVRKYAAMNASTLGDLFNGLASTSSDCKTGLETTTAVTVMHTQLNQAKSNASTAGSTNGSTNGSTSGMFVNMTSPPPPKSAASKYGVAPWITLVAALVLGAWMQ
jgi:hypothetical protein